VLNVPLISVVTATWGRPKTVVEHAIPAVASQTYLNVEHLIVTDGADRDLSWVLASHGYTPGGGRRRRISLGRNWTRPFGNESNGAICRQVGSYLAAGEWIAYLDDDNDWDPCHLQKLYDLTLPAGSADFVYSAFRRPGGGTGGAAPPQVGHVDTSTMMQHWETLVSGSWQPDGYTCDGHLAERLVAAGYKWAFQHEPTVTLHGPNFGRPEPAP
jgi:glycosyltransferase involved in cell wall biosynthesis